MGNRLKEVFSNQEVLHNGKISFKDKESYNEFIEVLNSIQEEGKMLKVNGVTDIETSVQNGNNIYPVFEKRKIEDVMICPVKEKVTFNIDTESGKKDINFSRICTNNNIVLETKQDEIVYLKIILEKGTGKSKITYRAQPEKAKSIAEIIDYYNMIVAFFNILFKQPIEPINDEVQIKEWEFIKSMENYFKETDLIYKYDNVDIYGICVGVSGFNTCHRCFLLYLRNNIVFFKFKRLIIKINTYITNAVGTAFFIESSSRLR